MKLFPYSEYELPYRIDAEHAMCALDGQTKMGPLINDKTDKAFIGKVGTEGFRVISSGPPPGAFCVFTGQRGATALRLKVTVNGPFKVLFSILMFLPTLVMTLSVAVGGAAASPVQLLPAIAGFLFFRFVFLGLAFRYSERLGMTKLTVAFETENAVKGVNS